MAEFFFPSEWGDAPLPKLPEIDPDRIEGLQNGFLAATQDALHSAPDAFYRTTGKDAVDGAPALQERLSQLRDATLAPAKDDTERHALAHRLDANLTYIQGGIDRHVAEQKLLRNQQIAEQRQVLNLRPAQFEHGDDSILPSVAEANASVAQHLARLRGEPEEPAVSAARSAVWRNAIDQRLATGQGSQALDLFGRVQDQLVPADQRALEIPIQAAQTDVAADQWIAREAAKPGDPLQTRVRADTNLSPAEKATVLAKVEVQDTAREATRLATVKSLDDQLEATAHSIATAPGSYRPGTLAALANAYEDAGEPATATPIRRLAQQESFLLSFAKSSAAAQQRLVESLPQGDARAAAEAIQDRQDEAFAKDAFVAGTALYPDVGPPKPIDDMAGRIAQARVIAAYRGFPVVPLTADEIAQTRRRLFDGTQEDQDLNLVRLNGLPNDVQAAVATVLHSSNNEADQDPSGMTDPNVVLAADEKKKEKKPPLIGGATRQQFDEELPQPRQIDPLGGRGVPGFRLPGATSRVLPKAPGLGSAQEGQRSVLSRQPLTPLEELPQGSVGGPDAGKRFSKKDRGEIPDGTPCIYCGQPTTKGVAGPDRLHLDHIVPRKLGGNSSEQNRAPACQACNLEKGARDPREWYDWREVH